ncbi:MAG: hypothetical protein KGL48_09295 [Sphingomonadales bacterium]|nr:hypothetical protein [Sphingomonadales bacterium]MDE2568401.1 hypothetical protein [Sphingomonadales bacterium]
MAPDTSHSASGSAGGLPALVVRLSREVAAPEVDYCGTGRIARLLVGREVGDVAPLLGRVFAICPAAQQLAARLALAAASGKAAGADEVAALALRARAESLREHGLRILLGWSTALGEAPGRELAATLNRETRGGQIDSATEQLERAVFGSPAAQWLAGESLGDWAAHGATVAARFIARALAEDLPHAPSPPAGTLVERHAAHPALTGLAPGRVAAFHAARLADLAHLLSGPQPIAEAQTPGPGAAQVTVDCSRGALRHRVAVASDRVSEYEIISPTDAAFAEHGFARLWLGEVAELPPERREAAVRAIVSALDPCTDTRVELA